MVASSQEGHGRLRMSGAACAAPGVGARTAGGHPDRDISESARQGPHIARDRERGTLGARCAKRTGPRAPRRETARLRATCDRSPTP